MVRKEDFILAEERLIRRLIAGWTRRGSSLMQIGLHSYVQPEFFWDAGFDVCATDEDQHIIRNASERTGPRIEYKLCPVEMIPVENNSYDYVFFTCYSDFSYPKIKTQVKNFKNYEHNNKVKDKELVANFPKFLQAKNLKPLFTQPNIYNEACRIASKGIIFLVKNSLSFKKNPAFGKGINIFSLLGLLKTTEQEYISNYISATIMPKFIRKYFNFDTLVLSYNPFGDILGVKINFNKTLMTGLGIVINNEQNLTEEPAIQREKTV